MKKYKCFAFINRGVNIAQNKYAKLYNLPQFAGYANGYVAIPPEHPLFNVHYFYVDFPIHGGVTFVAKAQ